MPTTIKLKNSVTTTNAPSSLVQGEVAINITDKKVWVGNAATTPIQLLGAGASGTFGALTCTSLTNSGLTSGRVTYAGTGGLLQDSANFTFNGTTVTMANDASISGLTVGKGGGAVATNTAVGTSGLLNNSTGLDNTAFGYLSMGVGIVTGNANTAIGRQALYVNTSGTGNNALGLYSLVGNTTGNYNNAYGISSLFSNTTGSSNTAIGSDTLRSNTTASYNTAVGYQAGYSNTTGTFNVYLGHTAGYAATGNYHVAVGYQAGYNMTATGVGCTFVGIQAGKATTSGDANVGLGSNALITNTTGANNTALGTYALNSNTTASNNTAVGFQAGYSTTTGGLSTFIGHTAGYKTTGGANCFVGFEAGYNNVSGVNNTYLGTDAGYSATGSYNTYVGIGSISSCAYSMTTGSSNTIIGGFTGNNDGYDMRTLSNRVVISDGAGNRQLTMYEGGTVALDNAVPAAGTGITFPATQSASTDANTLDDYEEGTWSPTITSGISSPTYSVQTGTYTKIGNVVNFSLRLDVNGGTRVGSRIFLTLPFTAKSMSGSAGLAYWSYANNGVVNSTTTNLPNLYIAPNTTNMEFYNTQGAGFLGTDLASATPEMYISGFYFTS